MHLDSAFHRFFKKIGEYPVFKKKRNSGSGKSEKREYDRARIILMDAEGKGVNAIASLL